MLRKALDHFIPKPATPARDHHQLGLPLPIPIERRALLRQAPIIQRQPVERLVRASYDADGEQVFQCLDQPFNMQCREATALSEQSQESLPVFERRAGQGIEEGAGQQGFGGGVLHGGDGEFDRGADDADCDAQGVECCHFWSEFLRKNAFQVVD